jgi:hypothetical protein
MKCFGKYPQTVTSAHCLCVTIVKQALHDYFPASAQPHENLLAVHSKLLYDEILLETITWKKNSGRSLREIGLQSAGRYTVAARSKQFA